jgi:hypothetical protein
MSWPLPLSALNGAHRRADRCLLIEVEQSSRKRRVWSPCLAPQKSLAAEAVLRESLKAEKRVLRDLGETRICVMAFTLRGVDLSYHSRRRSRVRGLHVSQRRNV